MGHGLLGSEVCESPQAPSLLSHMELCCLIISRRPGPASSPAFLPVPPLDTALLGLVGLGLQSAHSEG